MSEEVNSRNSEFRLQTGRTLTCAPGTAYVLEVQKKKMNQREAQP